MTVSKNSLYHSELMTVNCLIEEIANHKGPPVYTEEER